METKAMLPDSTQSETVLPASSAAPGDPSSARSGSSGRNTKGKNSDTSKNKKKRKSEDRTEKSSKKKKKNLGKEKSHKEEKSSKRSKKGQPEAKKPEEQDSDLDLENDLKPMRDYIKDREGMLRQMFKCVLKGDKLRAMLPDILKDVKMEELQELCLLQLEGMSKSRIMSILAGEEMQSSSDDDESDSDLGRVRSNSEADDNLINSEVVDSTSSLPQASLSVGDVEEVVSVQEAEEEVAGAETERGESDVEEDAECGREYDADSMDGSWQDSSERHERYSDDDVDEEKGDENSQRDEESDAYSLTGEDRDDMQEEEEEQTVVKKAKKFRRIKIVRAEGEECEEGEITSDEVETDEESVHSDKETVEEPLKEQGDREDATSSEPNPGNGTGEGGAVQEPSESVRDSQGSHGDAEESLPNSGNQANDDNGDDDSVDADDDANVNVVSDASVAKDVANASLNVAVDAVASRSVSNPGGARAAVGANADEGIADDSLNIFAEENLEMDLEEVHSRAGSEKVAKDSAKEDIVNASDEDSADDVIRVNKEDVATVRNSGVGNDNKIANDENVDDGNDGVSESDNNEQDSNTDVHESTKSIQEPPQPATQAPGAAGTAKTSGRKVAQELEVLELELRARAIRSLMKQYGKDVG